MPLWSAERRSIARTAGRRALLGCSALLVSLVACAKSNADWQAELSDRDPFVRALAAIALCEQAPEHASPALPVLLETVDRAELRMQPHAAAALHKIHTALLRRDLERGEFMTTDRRRALLAALRAGLSHPDPAQREAAAQAIRDEWARTKTSK